MSSNTKTQMDNWILCHRLLSSFPFVYFPWLEMISGNAGLQRQTSNPNSVWFTVRDVRLFPEQKSVSFFCPKHCTKISLHTLSSFQRTWKKHLLLSSWVDQLWDLEPCWSPGSRSGTSEFPGGPRDSAACPSGLEEVDPVETSAPCWIPGVTFWSVRGLVMLRFDRASRVPSGSTIMSITVRFAQRRGSVKKKVAFGRHKI